MCLGDIRNSIGVLSPGLLQALPTLAQVLTEHHRTSPATHQFVSSKCCWFLSTLYLGYKTWVGGQ